jgi:hypothetical protein
MAATADTANGSVRDRPGRLFTARVLHDRVPPMTRSERDMPVLVGRDALDLARGAGRTVCPAGTTRNEESRPRVSWASVGSRDSLGCRPRRRVGTTSWGCCAPPGSTQFGRPLRRARTARASSTRTKKPSATGPGRNYGRRVAGRSEIPGRFRCTARDENLVRVWLSSALLGVSEPDSEIDAGGLPGTAICCFEHVLQLR